MPFNPAAEERVPDPRLRGMNPEFVKMVWEKRRKEREARIAQMAIDAKKSEQAKATLNAIMSKYREIVARPNMAVSGMKTAEQIIKEGAEQCGFQAGDIKGPRRTRRLIECRHALIARVYVECPHLSLPQIGKIFGGRDHGTIHSAVVKMGVHYTQTGQTRAHRVAA